MKRFPSALESFTSRFRPQRSSTPVRIQAKCFRFLFCNVLFLFFHEIKVVVVVVVFFYTNSLCVKDDPPLTYQACVMSKDCHVSDWSAWSPCSKTCQSTDLSPGYSLRSRIMTQIPVGGGRRCPALEEKEACNIIGDLLPNCPRYFIHI